MKKTKLVKWALLAGLVFGSDHLFAQSDELIQGVNNNDVLMAALWTAFITLLIIFIILAGVTFSLVQSASPKPVATEEKEPFWNWFWVQLNAAVPQNKEQDILLDHNYDGIQELDNDLPPWWKYGFYLTIVIGVIYLFYYHGGNDTHAVSVSEYIASVEQAKKEHEAYLARMDNLIDESNVEFLSDEGSLKSGEKIFMSNCKTCHGALGEGGAGPNLTDSYWLHGGSIQDIFKTIKYGIPEKGMIAWQTKLTPKQMQQAASYIKKLKGTNPPNGKEPQGEEYKEEETEEVITATH